MIEDKDVVLFLNKWGREVLVGLTLLMVAIFYITLKRLWQALKEEKKSREVTIDWTQNLDELEIDFPLLPGKSSKDVNCRITSTSIRFAFKGRDEPELEGTLSRPVKPEECHWQLWPVGKPTHVKVNLVKVKAGHWKDVLCGENDKKSS